MVCCPRAVQLKLRVAPMNRAVAEGRASNKPQVHSDSEEEEGERALLLMLLHFACLFSN